MRAAPAPAPAPVCCAILTGMTNAGSFSTCYPLCSGYSLLRYQALRRKSYGYGRDARVYGLRSTERVTPPFSTSITCVSAIGEEICYFWIIFMIMGSLQKPFSLRWYMIAFHTHLSPVLNGPYVEFDAVRVTLPKKYR